MGSVSPSISLPSDLAALSTAHFDKLLASDAIKYAESTPEHVHFPGSITIEFRIIHSLSRKPLLPPSSSAHTVPHPAPPPQAPRKAPFNPFLDPRPEEIVLDHVGPRHRLLMNKYCTTRPMLLLTTVGFEEQSEDLNLGDLEACWAVLGVLDRERPFMAIYNCGPESGNSQLHKHMQCFPRFESARLHPDGEGRKEIAGGVSVNPGLPYQHFISYLDQGTDAEGLFQRYEVLLGHAKDAIQDQPGNPSYNVILVKDWMMVVPRNSSYREGVGTNATGVVGMIWLAREEERDEWERLGIMETLKFAGVEWTEEQKKLLTA